MDVGGWYLEVSRLSVPLWLKVSARIYGSVRGIVTPEKSSRPSFPSAKNPAAFSMCSLRSLRLQPPHTTEPNDVAGKARVFVEAIGAPRAVGVVGPTAAAKHPVTRG